MPRSAPLRGDHRVRRDHEPVPVAASAQRRVGHDRAEPARGVALAGVLDLLREDVERGQHAAVGDERHRHRVQRRVVRRPGGTLEPGRRPGLAVQREHLIAQRDRQVVLRVG